MSSPPLPEHPTHPSDVPHLAIIAVALEEAASGRGDITIHAGPQDCTVEPHLRLAWHVHIKSAEPSVPGIYVVRVEFALGSWRVDGPVALEHEDALAALDYS